MSGVVTTERTPDATTRWLTPGVVGIGGASFLADVGHEIPAALLPVYSCVNTARAFYALR